MNNGKPDMEDKVLERLLQRATAPQTPEGAHARLMERVRASSVAARPAHVLALPQKRRSGWNNILSFGLPLAASLVLGILFGSGNASIDSLLPESVAALINSSGSLEIDLPFTLDDSDLSDGSLA